MLARMATKTTVSPKIGLGVLATLSFLLLASACGTRIAISSDRYAPQFETASLPGYSGKAIVLRNFANVDENTSFYQYPGKGRRYGGPVLTSYFWYCFKSAFIKLGVNVFEEGTGPAGAPVMDVKLVRIDEAGFTADVVVIGATGQPPLQKRYTIAGPPITDRRAPVLEARAYQMVSALFWEIVTDPQFKSVALR